MDILNLVYKEKSSISYKEINYPDGQNQIIITSVPIKEVTIYSRLNNFINLEKIICAVASLRELGVEEIHLYVPYIMGSRSDRKFEEGGNNYLRDVICPVINNLDFKTVTCIDPHSDVLEACLNNFKKQDNRQLVHWALATRYSDEMLKPKIDLKEFILVSPDAGASKKIYKLTEQIGYKGDIITCNKDRGLDGKLTKTIVPMTEYHLDKDMIIIDDICDGGATFINIAKELRKPGYMYKDNKIYLIVTHGIFSKSTTELSHYFDKIYCTNSYRDLDGVESQLVKQLNVF